MTTPTTPSPVPPSVLEAIERSATEPDAPDETSAVSASETVTKGPSRPLFGSRPSLDFGVASLLSLFVFALLNWPEPDGWGDLTRPLLFLDTTPSGGDMGAHVWGPAFLRDHLLTSGRLSGWTPDWYAGFPAFHFYMVVPALAIIALNAGLPWFLGLPVAAGVLYGGRQLANRAATTGRWIMAAAVLLAVLVVGVPYGVAFKLVSVSGLVLFPLAAWAMARLAGAPRPAPAFVSMAAFIFLFDTNFTIYGGNVASTLAGEFAFSISLCLSLLAIGMVIRGLDDQRWRAPSAVVIGLVALCHIIPVFFLVPALLLAVLAAVDSPRTWVLAGMIGFALIPIAFADGTGLGIKLVSVAAVIVVMLSAMAAEPVLARRASWMLLVGPVSILLTAFWLVPFYLREPYFNDMGWERLNDVGPALLTLPIKIALPVALIGALIAVVTRERIGIVFAGTALLFASAVSNLGEGPLWNARLLPFYYLSIYILAAIGVAMLARFLASYLTGELERPDGMAITAATVAAGIAVLFAVAMPLRIVPLADVSASGDGSYRLLNFTNQARSLVPGWADWNYSGYEQKASYGEYHNVVSTMDQVGQDQGCGRAMWEYEKGLDRYGTPMALMLLPHWTDGCIGSMEGLYFESSATTPFHFLNQSVLSEAPSRAQRDLPYLGFDIDTGVSQLQVMGVRYYLAQSDSAIAAAREHPDLTEVADAQPFVVFEVDGTSLVEGLAAEPIVTEGRTAEDVAGEAGDPEAISRFEVGWVSQAVTFYNDPTGFVALPAEDGPPEWIRSSVLSPEAGTPLDEVTVSDIEVGTDSIGFTVDQVGVPVLVKISYFPNWSADGAEGPWRVGPNLMVVVPTEERVELSYGRTLIDLGGQALTVLGLAGVVGLGLLDRRRLRFGTAGPGVEASDGLDGLDPTEVGRRDWFALDPDADLTANLDRSTRREPTNGDDGEGVMAYRARTTADVPKPVRPKRTGERVTVSAPTMPTDGGTTTDTDSTDAETTPDVEPIEDDSTVGDATDAATADRAASVPEDQAPDAGPDDDLVADAEPANDTTPEADDAADSTADVDVDAEADADVEAGSGSASEAEPVSVDDPATGTATADEETVEDGGPERDADSSDSDVDGGTEADAEVEPEEGVDAERSPSTEG